MHFCKWNVYFWMLIFILALLASCNKPIVKKELIYFDTESYIKKEVVHLKKEVKAISAHIKLDGKEESQEFKVDTATSFDDLENLFTQVNINKVIFKDQYKIDTFWIQDSNTNKNIEVINYVSQNPELKIEWLQVYDDGSLKAKISENNFLFTYEKEIFYQKNEKFSTIISQKTIGLDTLTVFNELEYLYQ